MSDARAYPPDVHDAVPADLPGPRAVVEVITTYLEMRARPTGPVPPAPPAVEVVRVHHPSAYFYRYLYDTVGAPWHWYDRRRLPMAELARVIGNNRIEVHVLWQSGEPVGYAELDRSVAGEVELAYFGLVPWAIGRGLGRWLLAWAIDRAWQAPDATRLWVHTCTLDHPVARRTYEAAGFVRYGEERHRQTILAPAPEPAPAR
jgi:GNAT superfamily N-acetyltransferase